MAALYTYTGLTLINSLVGAPRALQVVAKGLVLMLSLAAGLCQAGQYYKWVDEQGITHFSEKPVTGMDAKKVGVSSKTEAPVAEAEKPATDTAAPASSIPTPQNINDENCTIAKNRLKALQSGQRIRLVGPDGKFSYLDENQIKEETQKTQDVLKASCAPAAP